MEGEEPVGNPCKEQMISKVFFPRLYIQLLPEPTLADMMGDYSLKRLNNEALETGVLGIATGIELHRYCIEHRGIR